MKYQSSLPILSKIIYATVTTLSDIQTLGEEYTGIIQINSKLKQLPSKKVFSYIHDCTVNQNEVVVLILFPFFIVAKTSCIAVGVLRRYSV